jgi:ribose-phosphate pyrophosphokinase
MRQDQKFHTGEGVSARYFGKLVSGFVDGLVTIDPHLHRIRQLGDVFSVPSRVVHAAPAVARWIEENVDKPILIGPDSESEQWVADVARQANAPFTVLEKVRHGDREVEVSLPDLDQWRDHTPVLVDDIISTGHTMMETIGHLENLGLRKSVCVGVHGVFAQQAYRELLHAGAARVVTSNSIPHESNAFELQGWVRPAIEEVLRELGGS